MLADQGEYVPAFPQNSKPSGNSFSRINSTVRDIVSVPSSSGGTNFSYVHSTGSAYIPRVNSLTFVNSISTNFPHPGANYCASDPLKYTLVDPEITKVDIANEQNPALKEYMISALIDYYNQNNQLAAAIEYLESLNRQEDWLRLIPAYIFSNNLDEAQALISNLINSNEEASIDQGILYNIVFNWKIQNLTPFQMSSADQEIIRMLAAKNTPAGEEARRIVAMVFNEDINNPASSDTGSGRFSDPNELASINQVEYVLSRTAIANRYVLSRSDGNVLDATKAQIFTIEGRLAAEIKLNCELECIIDLPNMSKGLYLLKVIKDEQVVTTLKINN
jgi:hypothetical protein